MYPQSYAGYPPPNARMGGAENYAYGYGGYGMPYAQGRAGYAMGDMYARATPAGGPSMSLSHPVTFEAMYQSQLAQLTFNSKPIITNLTLIAQENAHLMSTLVAKLIDAHILMVCNLNDTMLTQGTTATAASQSVFDGLDQQKHWFSVYGALVTACCDALHGIVSCCGPANTAAHGGVACDMAKRWARRTSPFWRECPVDH